MRQSDETAECKTAKSACVEEALTLTVSLLPIQYFFNSYSHTPLYGKANTVGYVAAGIKYCNGLKCCMLLSKAWSCAHCLVRSRTLKAHYFQIGTVANGTVESGTVEDLLSNKGLRFSRVRASP